MANADELLVKALTGDSEETNETTVLSIDFDSRRIVIPSNMKCLGVESDDDVTQVEFVMPRFYCDVDLSEFLICINYLNAKGEGDVYKVRDSRIVGDDITFTWLVGRNALTYKGFVKFNVCLKKMDVDDPSLVIRELNTTIASLPVLEGLETSEAVIQQYADILVQWELELDNKFNSFTDTVTKSVSAERIEEIINSYVKENPLVDEEVVRSAVNDYLKDNPINEDSIKAAVDAYLKDNPVGSGGVQFEVDQTLSLVNGVLSVNTADVVEQDNTLPITSAAVHVSIGNIEVLLGTI